MKSNVLVETKRAAFRLSHDAVAPSEYKAAYDQNVFPRSVFNDENREVRRSIIKRIFLKPKEKKETVVGVASTPVVKVSIKRKAEPLQEIPLNELKNGKTKRSTHCLNTTEFEDGKLPNAIASKIFKVLFLEI